MSQENLPTFVDTEHKSQRLLTKTLLPCSYIYYIRQMIGIVCLSFVRPYSYHLLLSSSLPLQHEGGKADEAAVLFRMLYHRPVCTKHNFNAYCLPLLLEIFCPLYVRSCCTIAYKMQHDRVTYLPGKCSLDCVK